MNYYDRIKEMMRKLRLDESTKLIYRLDDLRGLFELAEELIYQLECEIETTSK